MQKLFKVISHYKRNQNKDWIIIWSQNRTRDWWVVFRCRRLRHDPKQKLNKVINIKFLFWNLFQKLMEILHAGQSVEPFENSISLSFNIFKNDWNLNENLLKAHNLNWQLKTSFKLNWIMRNLNSSIQHHFWKLFSSSDFKLIIEMFVQQLFRSRQVIEKWTKHLFCFMNASSYSFSCAHHHHLMERQKNKQIVKQQNKFFSYLFRALILKFAFCAFTFKVTNEITVKS